MGNCMNIASDARRLEETINADSDDDDYKIDQGTKLRNKAIEKYMRDVARQESQIIKILLLGSGSSGKSTLFRQIECIHGEDPAESADHEMNIDKYDDIDRFFVNMESMKRTIRSNCINGLIKLLEKCDLLSRPPYNFKNCVINFNDINIAKAIKILVSFSRNSNHELEHLDAINTNELNILTESIVLLWNLEGVQETFKQRQYFSLTENMDYFFNKITAILDGEYEPSIEDILNARMQTTGIVERIYFIERIQFNIFDVGGQRNERRKWIQLFDAVNGLIFVAALNHYCCVLFEDETVNAMQESLLLFDEIANAKWFSSKHTQFILFLNKNDLFIQRLKVDKIPLSVCFNLENDKYYGKNFGDKFEKDFETEMEENEWFNLCYHEALVFIKHKYLSTNKNKRITSIFTHVTTATQKSNIKKVFDDVRMGIISQNLANSGFHVDKQEMNEMK